MTPTTNEYLKTLMGIFNAVCPAYFGQIEINEGKDTTISEDTMYYVVQITGAKRYSLFKSTNDNKVGAYIEGIGYGLIVANQEMKRIGEAETVSVYPEIEIEDLTNGQHRMYVDLGDGRRLFATTDDRELVGKYYYAEDPECTEAKHELINYVMSANGISDYDLCFDR